MNVLLLHLEFAFIMQKRTNRWICSIIEYELIIDSRTSMVAISSEQMNE